jgi:serine/threonine-protein kinase
MTMLAASSCPDENQLARFAQGTLVEAEAGSVEEHLDSCPACLEAVAAAVETVEPAAVTTGLASGTRVGGYIVEGLVGVGGMGAVYVAHDEALGRKVALKLVAQGADDAALTRLEREAQAMARLTHPNVVTVFALVHWEAQRCIAMEFVEGPTLAAWGASPRSVAERLRVLREAGEGLSAAHAAGLVHRDFKPQNVLVGADGRARVSDFGLSRATPGSAAASTQDGHPTLTQHGAVLGTPAYMAPEQLAGRSADARSDQFAYCVTLVECLTGHRPWPGRTLDALRAEVQSPPRLEGLPAVLRPVVARGLSVDPGARFSSMGELLAALVVAPPSRRGAWPVAAAGVALLALVAAAALFASRRPAPAPEAAPVVAPVVAPVAVPVAAPVTAPPTPVVQPASAPRPDAEPQPLRYEVGEGELRLLSAPDIVRVAIGDQNIADVSVQGAGELLIKGVAEGETQLLVWTKRGTRTSYPLRVVKRRDP